MHGRRQLVLRNVRLSPATSETPTLSWYPGLRIGTTLRGLPALSRRKEGATAGQHAPKPPGRTRVTMAGTAGFRPRKGEVIPQTLPQLGSRAETRPRERGIPSNRTSTTCGEYVPAPCTHRPSLHPSEEEVRLLALRGGESNFFLARGEKS